MNAFCTHCGAALPTCSDRESVCRQCGRSTLVAAKILVSCFVMNDQRLLWMRRAQPPQRGSWAIPAGFMELGESLQEAAARELREETGVLLEPQQLHLYSLGSITRINQVYVAFRASVTEVEFTAGHEALDVAFFSETELPWQEVAFPPANYSIRVAYDDVRRARFGLYLAQHERGELIDQLDGRAAK